MVAKTAKGAARGRGALSVAMWMSPKASFGAGEGAGPWSSQALWPGQTTVSAVWTPNHVNPYEGGEAAQGG